jgi:hypothetical protein
LEITAKLQQQQQLALHFILLSLVPLLFCRTSTMDENTRESTVNKPSRRSSVKERWSKIRASVLHPQDKNALKVNISQTDIDPELLKVQIEWADLLMHDNIQIFKPLQCGDLTKSQLSTVAASWFNDGVLGWKIDYPQNETQLKCYIFTRSRRFLQIYTFFFFLHILTPFFGEPNCSWADTVNNRTIDLWYTENGRFMSLFMINFIGFICVLIYCFEISMRLYVNNSLSGSHAHVLPWYKDKWIFIRLVCCVFLLGDILMFIFTQRPVRFARALLPFIYISRRNSLRQMFHGLWLAFLNSFGILSFLFAVVILWTFGGYILFRGVDVTTYSDQYESLYVNITEAQEQHLNRFDTPYEAFLTSLFAATSRSYNILVLNPYFPVTAVSSVFFVSLTVIADLIIINLMIAFGNRQYRMFAEKLFKRQLRNRRQAFVSIHSILADAKGNISRDTWLEFCSNCQGKYSVKKKMADTIFTLECENDPLKANYDTIDCVGLFRLSALLSNRVKMDVERVKKDPAEAQEPASIFNAGGVIKRKGSTPEKLKSAPGNEEASGSGTSNPMHQSFKSKAKSTAEKDKPSSSSTTTTTLAAAPPPKKSSLSMLFLQASPDDEDSDEDLLLDSSNHDDDDNDGDDYKGGASERAGREADAMQSASSSAASLCEKLELYGQLQATRLIRWSVNVSTPAVPCLWPRSESFLIEPYNLFTVLVKCLLVVQCGIISSASGDTKGWVVVGWVIMLFLWIEMIVKRLAWGRRLYLRRTGFGFTALLNLVTTILMISLGTDNINYSSPEFILYMILQSSRLLLLFRYLADSNAFISLFPLVYRIFFIIFSIFYFFSVIGYNRLCNVFRENNIEDDAVDDANTWLNFQKMFNFDSLLHTMYTCFYVSTLGNWTWIMNAAAQTEPFPSSFFFTTIRIVFTVAVYPILFSFLITAYINRRNKDEKAKGSQSDDHKGLENEILSFNVSDPVQKKEFKFERLQRQTESPMDVKNAVHRAVHVVYQKRYGFDSVDDRDSQDSGDTSESRQGGEVASASSNNGGYSYSSRGGSDHFSDMELGSGNLPAAKKIKSVAKLWMSQDKLTTKEMFDSYSNGSLMVQDTVASPTKTKADAKTKTKTDALMSKKTHESMMSHWSGGQEALTPGEKVKKKEVILKKLLEVTMQNIASEREDINEMSAEISALKRMFP